MTQNRRVRAAVLLNAAVTAVFAIAAIALVFIVRANLRREALREAKTMARVLLDRNLATHTYFTHQLKPAVFALSDRIMAPDYFEPAWMSSTYAVREIDSFFKDLSPRDYYYKECAINARSPQNEADPYERAFIEQLNRDPALQIQSSERTIDGRSYLTVLQRGESMEQSCLRCHDAPQLAPAGLVARYGPARSFGRHVGEVVSAVSIRVPLATAYEHADRTILLISLAMGGGFLGILAVQMLLSRTLVFGPLRRIGAKANEIATDDRHLGEQIDVPRGRELAELCTSFNLMSKTLREERDNLEKTVEERTAELRAANRELTAAAADIKTLSGLIPICAGCKKIRDDRGFWQQVEHYIAERSQASFSHGMCPSCLSEYFPERDRRSANDEDDSSAS